MAYLSVEELRGRQVPGKNAKMKCPNDKEDNIIKETEKKETKNENKEY